MYKRIFLISLLIMVSSLLIFSFASTEIYYNNLVDNSKETLKVYVNQYDSSYSFDLEGAKKLSLRLNGARVTFMKLDGTVIADSDVESLGNHSDREEVIQAIKEGSGYAIRNSYSIGKDLMYYCIKTDDGLIRISIPLSSQISIFASSIPTLIWFLTLDIILCVILTYLASGFILKPVTSLSKKALELNYDELKAEYKELEPIVDIMNDLKKNIDRKINEINDDRKMEAMILDNMEHGMIILDEYHKIILINKVAAEIVEYNSNTNHILLFDEDKELNDALKSNQNCLLYREFNDLDYAFRFTKTEVGRVVLITDVSDIKKAERSKNDFIANVTHEMNTPLTSIKGFAELIKTGSLDKEQEIKASQTIIKESDKLSSLIKQIINFSSFTNDDLESYDVDISNLANDVINNFEPFAKENGITLVKELDSNIIIKSRYERVTEILNNLISNAIRYNKNGGSVWIILKKDRLEVNDNGIGIKEEELPHIFDRFYTVDKSHNGSNGGFGLGLAIVKKICLNQGFKYEVKSKKDLGTSFKIYFNK